MYKSNKILTGIIINTNEQKVTFVAEGFRFTFLNTDVSLADVDLKPDSAGYIWGKILNADGAKIIAIFVKKPITVRSACVFNVWNYIVMDIVTHFRNDKTFEFPGFQGIRLINGSVMSVNPPWSLHEDFKKEKELNEKLSNDVTDKYTNVNGQSEDKEASNNIKDVNDANCIAEHSVSKDDDDSAIEPSFKYIVYRQYANAKKFTINQDECSSEWIFGSIISSRTSLDKGISLENNRSVLEIRFNESQGLQTFNDYYGYVTTLLEFLTFREAAPFEEIGLLNKYTEHSFVKFADCYVNTSIDIFANNSKTGQNEAERQIRNSMNSISVHLLSDDVFGNIIHSIMGTNKKNVALPIAIIPKDDRDAGIITSEKIKCICSTLEIEMNAAGIKLNKGDELESLIKDIKNVIKEHRDSEDNGLTSKTYDNMFNSISHWGDSLADRAIEAWYQNEAFLRPWLSLIGISISEKDIAAVVKARNDITHRGFQNIDENIAQTAFVMIGIIYVLALKRLKVKDGIIKDLMNRRIVG